MNLGSIPLLEGFLPVLLVVLGVAGALFLVVREEFFPDRGSDDNSPQRSRQRRRVRRVWPIIVGIAVVLGVVVNLITNPVAIRWLQLFPDELPALVTRSIGLGFAAIFLALATLFFTGRWSRRLLGVVAGVLVVALAASLVNSYFGRYETVSDLFGSPTAQQLDVDATRPDAQERQPDSRPAVEGWEPPADMPDHGTLATTSIPGFKSSHPARDAWIYLPPAFQTDNRPQLPVLILIPGQPGAPADWEGAGKMSRYLDAFAAEHDGLAPVVVVPDVTGATNANTMCMDSKLGNANTYLSQDVPDWIKNHLDVATDHRYWAIGGFSFGGTCTMQMLSQHPDVFRTGMAMSAEDQPAVSIDPKVTVERAFGGDQDAYNRQNPKWVMEHRTYDDVALYMAAGSNDPSYVKNMQDLSAIAREAGISVTTHQVPGQGHSWEVAREGLAAGLDEFAVRLGLAQE